MRLEIMMGPMGDCIGVFKSNEYYKIYECGGKAYILVVRPEVVSPRQEVESLAAGVCEAWRRLSAIQGEEEVG